MLTTADLPATMVHPAIRAEAAAAEKAAAKAAEAKRPVGA